VLAVLVLAVLGAVGALMASTLVASRPVDLGPGVVMRDDAAGSAPATDPSPASTSPSEGPSAPPEPATHPSAGTNSPAAPTRTASAPVVPAPPSSYDDDDDADDDDADDESGNDGSGDREDDD
jgi:hypothetical protein